MPGKRRIFGVSPTVFKLGIVSFLTDISSEMLVPVLPQFLKGVLNASGTNIGLIEGIAESTASLLRVWAGYLADKIGRPKLLTTIGYGLSALSKPFLLPATLWYHVLGVRFADRFGKGIRSAPRDVMIAENSEEGERGRAFGLHRTMDTLGAAVGPLVVIFLAWMVLRHTNVANLGQDRAVYTYIFLAAAVPAVLGWLVLVLFVPEKAQIPGKAERPTLSLRAFDRKFKLFLLAVTVFAVGNSSDAFLVIRATSTDSIGMSFISFLWVYVAFNLLQAVVTYRSGILSDRIGRRPLVIVGWLVFAGCYFAIARITNATGVWVTYLIYGAYYGLTEGVLRAYAVDLAPPNMKGTAVGLYYTFTGLALLPASIVAGRLWDKIGPGAPFYYGTITALAAVLIMVLFVREGRSSP